MRTSPSARTSDMITPAPRASGVAITRSPTRPSLTRMYSSSPIGESTLRLTTAVIRGRRGGTDPSSR
jgi:hypothetical protein